MSHLTARGVLENKPERTSIESGEMKYGSFGVIVSDDEDDGHILYRVGAKAFVDLSKLGSGQYWERPDFRVEILPSGTIIKITTI